LTGQLWNSDLSVQVDSHDAVCIIEQQKNSTDYYKIIKEIAKLKRYELLEFKKRFSQIIEDVKSQTFSLPYRFTITRTRQL
jgi:hypothetical protein